MDRTNRGAEDRDVVLEMGLTGRWTHLLNGANGMLRLLHERIAQHADAVLPVVVLGRAHALFVEKATIRQHRNPAVGGQAGAHLRHDRLIDVETNQRAGMPQGLPGARDGPPALDTCGTNHDQSPQHGGSKRDIPVGVRLPIAHGRLQHGRIPLGRGNGALMEPAGQPPHPAGGLGCAPVHDFGPGGQAHGARQTQTDDRPGERDHAANSVINTAGNVGEEGVHYIAMQSFGISHRAPQS